MDTAVPTSGYTRKRESSDNPARDCPLAHQTDLDTAGVGSIRLVGQCRVRAAAHEVEPIDIDDKRPWFTGRRRCLAQHSAPHDLIGGVHLTSGAEDQRRSIALSGDPQGDMGTAWSRGEVRAQGA
jgi:hypothetical protein